MYVCPTYKPRAHGDQKGVIVSGTEVKLVVNGCMGAGNQTQVIFKSNKYLTIEASLAPTKK